MNSGYSATCGWMSIWAIQQNNETRNYNSPFPLKTTISTSKLWYFTNWNLFKLKIVHQNDDDLNLEKKRCFNKKKIHHRGLSWRLVISDTFCGTNPQPKIFSQMKFTLNLTKKLQEIYSFYTLITLKRISAQNFIGKIIFQALVTISYKVISTFMSVILENTRSNSIYNENQKKNFKKKIRENFNFRNTREIATAFTLSLFSVRISN